MRATGLVPSGNEQLLYGNFARPRFDRTTLYGCMPRAESKSKSLRALPHRQTGVISTLNLIPVVAPITRLPNRHAKPAGVVRDRWLCEPKSAANLCLSQAFGEHLGDQSPFPRWRQCFLSVPVDARHSYDECGQNIYWNCAPGTRTPKSSSRGWRVSNYTRAQRWPKWRISERLCPQPWTGSGYRRKVAAGVGDLLARSGDVDPIGEQAPRFG